MRNTKKIRYTRELHETLVFRRQAVRLKCSICGCEREFMTPDEFTSVFGIATRDVMSFVETGRFHSVETARGQMLICLGSVIESSEVELAVFENSIHR